MPQTSHGVTEHVWRTVLPGIVLPAMACLLIAFPGIIALNFCYHNIFVLLMFQCADSSFAGAVYSSLAARAKQPWCQGLKELAAATRWCPAGHCRGPRSSSKQGPLRTYLMVSELRLENARNTDITSCVTTPLVALRPVLI